MIFQQNALGCFFFLKTDCCHGEERLVNLTCASFGPAAVISNERERNKVFLTELIYPHVYE